MHKIGFRNTHVLVKYDGHIVQVPNVMLAAKPIANTSMRELRREKFAFQFQPNQPAAKLAAVQGLVREVFKQPAVADWQQYLPEGMGFEARDAADAAGPTKLEAAVFTGANATGALAFEISWAQPHPNWDSFRCVTVDALATATVYLTNAKASGTSERSAAYAVSPALVPFWLPRSVSDGAAALRRQTRHEAFVAAVVAFEGAGLQLAQCPVVAK